MPTENSPEVDPDTGLPTEGLEEGQEAVEGEEKPSEVEVLEKRFKDAQAKITELATANAELTGKVSVLAQPEPEVAEDPWADIDEEEAVANPMILVDRAKKANAMLTRDIVGVLREFRAEFGGMIEKNNPERLAMKTVIDELKQDPEFAGLDDGVLLKIAKRNARVTPVKEVVKASGAPGGGSRITETSTTETGDVRKSSLYQEIYGDKFDDSGKERK